MSLLCNAPRYNSFQNVQHNILTTSVHLSVHISSSFSVISTEVLTMSSGAGSEGKHAVLTGILLLHLEPEGAQKLSAASFTSPPVAQCTPCVHGNGP